MVTSLTPTICVPGDFINPYPALFWSTTVCATLLSLEAFVFFLTARNFYQVGQVLWFSRIRHLVNIFAVCIAMVAWVLVAWLGWQSLHFVTFCSIGGLPGFTILALQAGRAAVMVVVSLTALVIVGGLVLLASQFWLSKTVQRAR